MANYGKKSPKPPQKVPGPAGSGVPGQDERRIRGKFMGFAQTKSGKGYRKYKPVRTGQSRHSMTEPKKTTTAAEQRARWKQLTATTRAKMASKRPRTTYVVGYAGN